MAKRSISMTDQNTDRNLHELLDQLHKELEKNESIDENGSQMLRHLDQDIRKRLERSGRKMETDSDVLERLQHAIDHFETTHPNLTLTLSEMMSILSNAGI
jgi:hypothetical protein